MPVDNISYGTQVADCFPKGCLQEGNRLIISRIERLARA
jgi:hypothetical protein